MRIADADFIQHSPEPKQFTFEVNAYYVTIRHNGVEVFDRDVRHSDWLDAKHQRIVEALNSLEKALREAVQP